MKQIFTLLTTVLCTLATPVCVAQFYEGFETPESVMVNNCWKIQQLLNTTNTEVISGNQSLISTPLNGGKVQGKLTTPVLDVFSNTFTLNFNWRLLNKMPGNASRSITIYYQKYGNGQKILIDQVIIPAGTPVEVNNYSKLVTVPAPGPYQILIDFDGKTGDGNQHLIFDDLKIDGAQLHYGPTKNCNRNPQAKNDNFVRPSMQPVGGNVLDNDADPDNEKLSPVLVTPSPDGTITFAPDGTFTFTPFPTFTGTSTSFSYRVTDNGYDPLQSNIAIVTINFFEASVLPLTLTNYEGKVENDKAALYWTIAENELAVKFVVEKSTDGKNFAPVKTVYPTKKDGIESYTYKETAELKGNAFYRLQLISSDSYFEYSKMLVIKNQKQDNNSNIILVQNPIVNKLSFNYYSKEKTLSNVTIYNAFGTIVYSGKMATDNQTNTLNININNSFKKGSYILEVWNQFDRSTAKFLKQ